MSETYFLSAQILADERRQLQTLRDRLGAPDSPLAGWEGLSLVGPDRTTLARLRTGGLPPARLKWASGDPLHLLTLHYSGELAGTIGRCTARQLRAIGLRGDIGFADLLRPLLVQEFSDLYAVCTFVAPDSELVGWHLVKDGKVQRGGALQNLKAPIRYQRAVLRWTGLAVNVGEEVPAPGG